jgi:AraC family transcriptional regulator of adaptative response/methylated-DNA-[protein]-cysteine methyltransferase
MEHNEHHRDYHRVAAALRYLEAHRDDQPGLEQVAGHVGLSPFHFQKLFGRWVGISPKRFLQYLTVEHARRCLADTRSVLDATHDAGLSSPGRLHDLMVAVDAVTPGEHKSGGAGLAISCGNASSPFGACLIGTTDRGVCWLSFHDEAGPTDALDQLRQSFPAADLAEEPATAVLWSRRIFADAGQADARPLPVLLSGTNFQLKVWEALLRVPFGRLCSYRDLAGLMGRPSATRAVASAVAANRIAYLIPCHRVICSMGGFGQYRWGAVRKRAIIGWEQAKDRRAGRAVI